MIKILQFGEGNFLRAFVDDYFDVLKKEGGELEVTVVNPTPRGNLEKFAKQNNEYHIIFRGVNANKPVEEVYKVNVVKNAINPFTEKDKYLRTATDENLRIVTSNTTEAGIRFDEKDEFDGFETVTYPAKLTQFLYERFKAGLGGLYVLPTELIDNNADELFSCVIKYVDLWGLPADFKKWLTEENCFCNTLVDRIVSGYPKDEETEKYLTGMIGKEDGLMTVCEPFGLWVVENKGNIGEYIKEGFHGVQVVLTKDIGYYKKRKVRVLNGSHTNLVPVGLWAGKETVYDCMTDNNLRAFLNDTLENEIIPFVSDDTVKTKAFAVDTLERFSNPYLNHRLTSIALNSISKWRARNLPSFKDFYNRFGKIPPDLSKGFAYLMAIYETLEKEDDGKYYVTLPSGKTEWKDDESYLSFFADGGSIVEFMRDESVWGEDLTQYQGFAEFVINTVNELSGQGN